MTAERRKSLILLHFIVFLWGFTAILGKGITLAASYIVWYRMGIATLSIWIYRRYLGKKFRISRKERPMVFLGGILLTAHWYSFFAAIQASNVSVTLATLSSGAFFTALIEPLFFKRRINLMEMFFALLVIIGLSIIFTVGWEFRKGIGLALISALLAALFTVINGKSIQRTEASLISFYQLGTGFVLLSIFLTTRNGIEGSTFAIPTGTDTLLLLILGTVCTAYAFTVGIEVMKHLSPYTVSLANNLEPVYGILLAVLFFGSSEFMGARFYLGGAILLIAIFGESVLRSRQVNRKKKSI